MKTITGTSYFVSRDHAEKYYEAYERDAASAVSHKLKSGEIHIGKPVLKSGQRLQIIADEGRYAIIED